MMFLGIDTSCYTTSVALVDETERVIENIRVPLTVELGKRGIRQSDAVFLHLKTMPCLFEKLGGQQVSAVAASETPRPQEGSYMPVFQAAKSFGQSIASILGAKYFPSTHQHGHLYAALLEQTVEDGEYLACHASGGTTEFIRFRLDNGLVRGICTVGGTKDITCGQLIDRIGVLLGLKFPAGAPLEQLAIKAKADGLLGKLPVTVREGWANLSGAETKAKQLLQQGCSPQMLAGMVFACASETMVKLALEARQATGLNRILFFGGVISSALIKEEIILALTAGGMEVLFARPEYSADNAAGLALYAKRNYFLEGEDHVCNNH